MSNGPIHSKEGSLAKHDTPVNHQPHLETMKFTATLSTFLLAVSALAQSTPPGFTPATNVTLDVYYGTQYISPGLIIKKSSTLLPRRAVHTRTNTNTPPGTQKAPVIGLTNTTLSGKYLLAMIGTSTSPSPSHALNLTHARHRRLLQQQSHHRPARPPPRLHRGLPRHNPKRHNGTQNHRHDAVLVLRPCATSRPDADASLRVLAA